MNIAERCRIHAAKMDDEGWYVTANVLWAAADEIERKGSKMTECKLVVPSHTYQGKQGLTYWEGVSRETVGSDRICMHLLRIQPALRAIAHLHREHETAIYMLEGVIDTWWGNDLEHFVAARPGDHFYIPANVPHLPWNRTARPATCIIARTDPNEKESVEVLPDLDAAFMRRMKEAA